LVGQTGGREGGKEVGRKGRREGRERRKGGREYTGKRDAHSSYRCCWLE